MNFPRLSLRLLAAPALAWALLLPSPARAGDAPAAPPAQAAAPQDLAALRKKLAEAEAELAQAPSRAQAEAAEAAEAGFLRQQLVRAYQRQIDNLQKLRDIQARRERLAREAAAWAGFAGPPPYSFLLVDRLREAAASQQARLQALQEMDRLVEQETLTRKEYLGDAGGKLRQANEALEDPARASPRLVWLRDFAALRVRLAEERVKSIDTERQVNQAELAEARQRLDFALLQLGAAAGGMAFPEADRAQVRQSLAEERRQLQAELEAAFAALDALRGAAPAGEDELPGERLENASLKAQMLSRLLDGVKLRGDIWARRFEQADSQDAAGLALAYQRLDKAREELRPLKEFAVQHLTLVDGLLADLEKQAPDPDSPPRAAYRAQLQALYGEREGYYRRMLWGVEGNLRLLELCRQDLDDRHQAEPWRDRAQEWLAFGRAAAASAWAFELFAVEDTVEVDGQPVTGKRSVTLGKLLTALSILVVGLFLSSRLAGLGERIAVRRGRMDAGSARVARRWIMFLVGLVLVAASLLVVKIPLSVFAFAGGALAIGAGFGMQNLLKNLISGLMLLWERPFRPGDLVEVGGIRGRVADIGVRSSHLRDANGIETVIPNSTFVEENVTNWTLSSRSVRIAVKLGVAYGSDVQLLGDLLREAAGRHGLVQKDPAPLVLFEDFGADALQFGLYVWVELRPGVDWGLVASDLRHMINKTLAANGIAMPFAQRDVHLDAAAPLPVRVVADGG